MKNTTLKRKNHIVVLLMLFSLRGMAQHDTSGGAPQGVSNIEFVENKGQWDPRVKFMGEVSGGNLFLEKGGYTALLYQPGDVAKLTSRRHGGADAAAEKGG